MGSAVIHPIGVYIRRRQAAIEERVAFCPIYEIFTEEERMPGNIRMVQWWNQDVVNEPEE